MNSNNNYNVSKFKLASEKKNCYRLNWSIRGNIFISGKHTNMIADKIENEYWGSHNHQLYHYIDYTFRTRIMENEVKVYKYTNGEIIAVFNTGLVSRDTKKELYLLCKPNSHQKKNPFWAVPDDNIDDISKWFMTKDELMKNYGINECDLPKNIEYIKYKNNSNTFNKRCRCDFNWYKIFSYIITPRAKKTITEELKRNGCSIETKKIKYLLSDAFTNAVQETLYKANNHNKYIIPGLFMDFDNQEYWVNLMMYVSVYYGDKYHQFVIVMDKNYNRNEYVFVDVLSLKQGYYNGRYIQKLPDFWKPKSKIISPTIKSQNIESKTLELCDLSDLTPNSSSSTCITNKSDKSDESCKNSIASKISKISISSNATNISSVSPVSDTKSVDSRNMSPTPFSLTSNENDKCNNINDDRVNNNGNNHVDLVNEPLNIITTQQTLYNSFTGNIETAYVTKFTDNTNTFMTETIKFDSGVYFSKMYSLKSNQLIYQNSGTLIDLFNLMETTIN